MCIKSAKGSVRTQNFDAICGGQKRVEQSYESRGQVGAESAQQRLAEEAVHSADAVGARLEQLLAERREIVVEHREHCEDALQEVQVSRQLLQAEFDVRQAAAEDMLLNSRQLEEPQRKHPFFDCEISCKVVI
jgi:hypothetical protein